MRLASVLPSAPQPTSSTREADSRRCPSWPEGREQNLPAIPPAAIRRLLPNLVCSLFHSVSSKPPCTTPPHPVYNTCSLPGLP